MFGAVFGDIIGSYYELHSTKSYHFDLFHPESRFTDDTVLTAAVCDTILYRDAPVTLPSLCSRAKEYAAHYKAFYKRYPHAGFGEMFIQWANAEFLYRQRSFANGAAMRCLPIGLAYCDLRQVELQVYASCLYTHCHHEAIQGAQAAAGAVFLAAHGSSKAEIRSYLERKFRYCLQLTCEEIREAYQFDSSAAYSVPPAIIAFLESSDYEDCVRRAVSLGGDADTMACIAGGIAEAYYGEIPKTISDFCLARTDMELKRILRRFYERYAIHPPFPVTW